MDKAKRDTSQNSGFSVIGFLSDVRVLQIIAQAVFLFLLIFFLTQIANSIFESLRAKNIIPTFAFFSSRAGFEIGNAPPEYTADSSYWDAFMVGVGNTFRIISVGLVATTILGVFVGIALLSTNWLVRTIARGYVELLRNTPLLVQIFFWYFGLFISLPQIQQAIQIPPEGAFGLPLRFVLYIVVLLAVFFYLRRQVIGKWWHDALYPLLVAAIVVIELGFGLFRDIYGLGGILDTRFMIFLVVSAVFIGAAYYSPQALRVRLLGLALGWLVGGTLYYFALVPASALPPIDLAPLIYISNRGVIIPQILPTTRLAEWLAFVVIGIGLAVVQWIIAGQITELTGRKIPRVLYALLLVIGLSALGWWFVGQEPAPTTVPIAQEDGTTAYMPLNDALEQGLLTDAERAQYSRAPVEVILPRVEGRRQIGGETLQAQYVALLLALVTYTSTYIAEIVRAGILAVPRGQIEAARALGLGYGQILQMIILPQALRVVIPPLGNQYLNLSKNSSLAVGIAFADAVNVMNTVMNQSGQSVPGIIVLMGFYLLISLTIALVINWVNRRFQLVTR